MAGGKMNNLRVVLLGKTGAGKSSSGNTILGPKAFVADDSADSVTSLSTSGSAVVAGRQVCVTDTPGLCSTSMDEEQVKSEIKRCISLSVPGPHVFLLVIRLGRFTQEEKSAVEWIQKHFREEASKYTMVLFTGADQIKRRSVEEFLNSSKELQDLLDSCGRRYYVFNNEGTQNRVQVSELLQKIEEMVKLNGGQHYTNEMYQEAERMIKAEEESKRKEAERIKREKEEMRRDEDTTKYVIGAVGGVIGGALATGPIVLLGTKVAAGAVKAAAPQVAKAIGTAAITVVTKVTTRV